MSKDTLTYTKHFSFPRSGYCEVTGTDSMSAGLFEAATRKVIRGSGEFDTLVLSFQYDRALTGTPVKYSLVYKNKDGQKSSQNGDTKIMPPDLPKEFTL